MPYKTRKVGDKYCVYKKEGGKKVGCTKGTEKAKKKYLAALHIADESVNVDSFKMFFESTHENIDDLKKMIANPDPERVKEYGGTAYVDMLKKKLDRMLKMVAIKDHLKKSPLGKGIEDAEIDAADGAMKGIKAKERLNFIDNIMSTYEGKSLAFYKKMLKKSSNFKDGKLTPYELFTIEREMKRQKQKKESTNLEENRAYVHNPRKIKAFINQVEKEFPKYKGEIKQAKDDQIVFPNDPKLIKFFKGAREVKFVLKDSVKLEEAEDRCKRKADQVYGKKTSAYKSGAIVRCRKGKIWKKK